MSTKTSRTIPYKLIGGPHDGEVIQVYEFNPPKYISMVRRYDEHGDTTQDATVEYICSCLCPHVATYVLLYIKKRKPHSLDFFKLDANYYYIEVSKYDSN